MRWGDEGTVCAAFSWFRLGRCRGIGEPPGQRRDRVAVAFERGAAVASQARDLLARWRGQVNDARHRIGRTMAHGTTEFTPRFVGTAWHRVADEFAAREIELSVVHVRTKDSFARLDTKEMDLLCSGFASEAGADDIPGDYEFLRVRTGRACAGHAGGYRTQRAA